MKERNTNLDLIKCLACFAVVGLHAVGMNNYTIYYLCGLGVPLFFMVNGYLMFSREALSYRYAFRKILHILKIVFLWNLLIAIPVFIFRQKIINPFILSVNSLLQKGYLWHFWFFGALLLLYLFLPPLFYLFCQKQKLFLGLFILLMIICLTMSILSMVKGYPLHMFIPQSLRLWTWLFYFMAGGIFCRYQKKLCRLPLLAHALLLAVSLFFNNFALKKVGLYLTHSRLAEYFYDNISSMLFYLLLFSLLMRIPDKKIAGKRITALSSLTLGIFIIHPILLTGIGSLYTPSDDCMTLLFWLGLTLISLFAAFILSKIPFLRELIRL